MENRLLLLLILAGCNLPAPGIDAHDLVRRSVKAIEANWSRAPQYSFIERDVQSKKHSAAAVKSYEVVMIRQRAGCRGSEAASRDREKTRRVAKGACQEGWQIRKRAHAKSRHVVGHGRCVRLSTFGRGTGQWARLPGSGCAAKPSYQPKNRETKVLAGMRGRLWIDKKQTQWVKVQDEVFKPVSFYGSIAKDGPGTRFMLEQEPVADNVWLPKRFSVKVNATALGFINEDSSTDETYHDYKSGGVSADARSNLSGR